MLFILCSSGAIGRWCITGVGTWRRTNETAWSGGSWCWWPFTRLIRCRWCITGVGTWRRTNETAWSGGSWCWWPFTRLIRCRWCITGVGTWRRTNETAWSGASRCWWPCTRLIRWCIRGFVRRERRGMIFALFFRSEGWILLGILLGILLRTLLKVIILTLRRRWAILARLYSSTDCGCACGDGKLDDTCRGGKQHHHGNNCIIESHRIVVLLWNSWLWFINTYNSYDCNIPIFQYSNILLLCC